MADAFFLSEVLLWTPQAGTLCASVVSSLRVRQLIQLLVVASHHSVLLSWTFWWGPWLGEARTGSSLLGRGARRASAARERPGCPRESCRCMGTGRKIIQQSLSLSLSLSLCCSITFHSFHPPTDSGAEDARRIPIPYTHTIYMCMLLRRSSRWRSTKNMRISHTAGVPR